MKTLLFILASTLAFGQTALINGSSAKFRNVTGTAAPSSGTCDASSEVGSFYVRTGDQASVPTQVYVCKKTGASTYAWGPFFGYTQTAAPATCATGELWFDTDATAGSNLNLCTSNTWTAVGSGSTNMQLLYSGGAGTTSCPSAITTLNAGTYTPSTVSFATGDTIVVRAVIQRTGSAGTNTRLIIGWDGADSARQTSYGYIREMTADSMLQYTARIRITSSSAIMTTTTAEWGGVSSLLSTSTGLTFSSQPTITIRSSNCSSTDTVNVVLFEVWKFTGGTSL